uniref:PKS_DH domain-containing protein n=1 Tax=Ascaris lumbricoides TaxID=6252 RepID=A0A0M3IMZ0_ASCLU
MVKSENVGTALFYNHPKIYSSSLPTDMAAENANLQKVIGKKYQIGPPFTHTAELVSAGGNSFSVFAKTGEFNKDLYDGFVAPQLGIPLLVETWRRGSEVKLQCRAKFLVLDAQDIKVGEAKQFKYTRDHSKFAVSSNESIPFTCIGDINRMSEVHRHEGVVMRAQLFDPVTSLAQKFSTRHHRSLRRACGQR